MELIQSLLKKTFYFTRQPSSWWLLSLVQLVSLSVLATFTKTIYLKEVFFTTWFLVALLLLSLSTLWLWLNIQAKDQSSKQPLIMPVRIFIGIFLRFCLVNGTGYLVIYFFRQIFTYWVTLTFFSSLLIVTWVGVDLFIVLCRQKINNALRLILDLWSKRSLIPAIFALSLMISHGISFASAHLVSLQVSSSPQFSVLYNFGTMLVLLVMLLFLSSIIVTAVNIFLVLGFLAVIKRNSNMQKDKEAKPAIEPVASV